MTRPRKQSALDHALDLFCRKQLARAKRLEGIVECDAEFWRGYGENLDFWDGYSTAVSELIADLKRIRAERASSGGKTKSGKRVGSAN